MMPNRRSSESGVTLIDVAAASFITAVSLVGLISTIVYQRNLEEQTTRLWEAAGTATATLEDLRADSRTGWSSLTATWEGHTVDQRDHYSDAPGGDPDPVDDVADGSDLAEIDVLIDDAVVEDITRDLWRDKLASLTAWLEANDVSPAARLAITLEVEDFLVNGNSANNGNNWNNGNNGDRHFGIKDLDEFRIAADAQHTAAAAKSERHALAVTVTSDETALSDQDGMWTTGQAKPNFYLVNVAATSEDNEFSNALRFQTYVTDRTGLDASDETGDAGGGDEDAEAPVTFDDHAEAVNPTPASVAVSGADDDLLTISFENWSTMDLEIKKVGIEFLDGGEFAAFSVGGAEYYNDKAKDQKTMNAPDDAGALGPGTFDIQIQGVGNNDEDPIYGLRVGVTIEFTDGSTFEFEQRM